MPARSPHNIAFGKALREIRKAQCPKMTQERLAEISGIDRTFVSLLERGDRSPTLNTIFALSQALEISPLLIMERTIEMLKTIQD